MPLFRKTEEHTGSGIDKPEPKSLLSRVKDKIKPASAKPVLPPKGPSAP